MKHVAQAALIALARVNSGAQAETAHVHLDGYLETQLTPGQDQNFNVGDKFTLTASYDTADLIYLGPDVSYQFAAPTDFHIRTPGVASWDYNDESTDGYPYAVTYRTGYYDENGIFQFYEYGYGPPLLAIQDGKVLGVSGFFYPVSTVTTPAIETGSDLGAVITTVTTYDGEQLSRSYEVYSNFNPVFRVEEANLYGNFVETKGFVGRWDFANSTAGVPEPTTWALMIGGFGLVGAAMRRRQTANVTFA